MPVEWRGKIREAIGRFRLPRGNWPQTYAAKSKGSRYPTPRQQPPHFLFCKKKTHVRERGSSDCEDHGWKTQAKNSHLRAYLACAEKLADALPSFKRCKLAAVDGINVEVAGRLDDETLLGLRETHGLENGIVIRWQKSAPP